MSVKVSSWVWHEAPVTDRSELLVLLALADHARDDGGGAYPSVSTLTTKARLSRRAVFDALGRLKAAGLIVADGVGPRGTVAYRICLGVQPLHGADPAPVQPAARGGADLDTQGVQPAAPEPSLEPSYRTSKGARACATAPSAPSSPDLRGLDWQARKDAEAEHAAQVAAYDVALADWATAHFPDAEVSLVRVTLGMAKARTPDVELTADVVREFARSRPAYAGALGLELDQDTAAA